MLSETSGGSSNTGGTTPELPTDPEPDADDSSNTGGTTPEWPTDPEPDDGLEDLLITDPGPDDEQGSYTTPGYPADPGDENTIVVTPEPTTILLLGIGLAGMAGLSLRRMRKTGTTKKT